MVCPREHVASFIIHTTEGNCVTEKQWALLLALFSFSLFSQDALLLSASSFCVLSHSVFHCLAPRHCVLHSHQHTLAEQFLDTRNIRHKLSPFVSDASSLSEHLFFSEKACWSLFLSENSLKLTEESKEGRKRVGENNISWITVHPNHLSSQLLTYLLSWSHVTLMQLEGNPFLQIEIARKL